MIAATQHDRMADEDYARLAEFDIRTVRETVRWHLIEQAPGRYDFSSLEPMARAAARHGIKPIWDLCHYGWPADVDIFAPEFVERFRTFSAAVAVHLRENGFGCSFFTPVNEPSFLAWAAAEVGWFHPFAKGRANEAKRQLVRAMIAGGEAVLDRCPGSRLVSVDPLIHTVPPAGHPEMAAEAAAYRESQFEAFDMLAGERLPELGGSPERLDIIGVNFYHDNQWEYPGGRKIHWHIRPRDSRWVPFHRLIAGVYERYRRPIFVAETSHVGVGRAEWIREMTDEVCLAIEAGVPIAGICLYPILDRFDWDDPSHWHNSGLWDYDIQADGSFRRVLNEVYAAELRLCQGKVRRVLETRAPVE